MPEEQKKETFSEQYDRRENERKAVEDQLRLQLLEAGFDGPFKIEQADPLFGVFGDRGISYAICIGPESRAWKGCGAMIRLGDPMERGDGQPPIERGVNLHSAFHKNVHRG